MNNKTVANTLPKNMVIDFTKGKAKSVLKLGYIKIYLENDFNRLQKKMFKFLLGIEIEDIGDSNVKD